ncbi:DUF222 domain-containing protein [Promicromonospora vindobonensis]|uniref:DUF222 domain-containing protein n=1 Tax=Promicromonospora vindobonensis TaxID=195748 RepID=A0ABW5VUS0_9MICO
MTRAVPSASGSRRAPRPRALEEVLAELESLADELIAVGGPDAVAGVGEFAGAGGVVASRLAEVTPRLRALGTRLDTVRLTWLPVIEAEHPWQTSGARTFSAWLARSENVSTTTAKREVRTGRVLRDHLPSTRAAALSGGIGADHLRALVDVAPTSDARRAALVAPIEPEERPEAPLAVVTEEPAEKDEGDVADEPPNDGSPGSVPLDSPTPPAITGEEYLTGLAGACDPSRFRRVLKRFGQVVDPDADDRGYKEATEREHLEVSPTFGGWHVNGFLTEEHGHLLSTALGAMMGAPTPGDDRTLTQRRAQALADLAHDVLDNGRVGSGAAVRPHVHVTVSLTELTELAGRPRRSGAGAAATSSATVGGKAPGLRPGDLTSLTAQPATLTGAATTGSVVPRDLLRRLTCDAEITRVVFGPDGTAIDVGRAQRTVTGQLRKAVIARDQHCVYPGCDQPPSRCEVHHALRHWADGGETSVANSALLCWHHHTLVDTTGITMAWERGTTPDQPGRWTFTNRHGHRIELRNVWPRAA